MKQTFSGIQMILAFVAGLLLGILIILSIVGINSLTGKEEKPAAPAEEQVDNPKVDIQDVQEEEYPRETLTKERPYREDTRIYSSEQIQPVANRPGNNNSSLTDGVNRKPNTNAGGSNTTNQNVGGGNKNTNVGGGNNKPKAGCGNTNTNAGRSQTSNQNGQKKETTKSTRSMKDGYESKSNYNPKSDPCATGGNSWY